MLTRVMAAVVASVGICAPTFASPWIEPGDTRSRHHIQFLVDSGALNIPSNTWPLPWASVKQGMERMKVAQLSPAQAWSLSYLEHAFDKASASAYTQSRSHLASSQEILQGFEASSREEKELQTGLVYTGNNFAMKLTATFVDEPSDGKRGRADGSYMALLFGNWAAGIGAVDQWWGPGWHSSTIISTNARPAPGFFLRRNRSDAFETPLLSWLGEWQFTTFANEIQGAAYDDDKPLLWGARASATPLQGLEVGIGRTILWADSIELETLDATPIDISPNTINYTATSQSDRHKQTQLTSIDIRYGFNVGSSNIAAYAQATQVQQRQQEKGTVAMGGIDVSAGLWGAHHRLTLEASNSISGFYDEAEYNTSYETNSAYQPTSNANYPSGYRNYGRNIAVNSDNDSEIISLAGQHYFSNGHAITWRYSHADINRDGTIAPPLGDNAFSIARTQVDNTQLQYRLPITARLMAEVGASHLSRDITINNETVKSSLHLSLFHHW